MYFTVKTCFQRFQILETNGKVWRKEDLTVLEKDLVRMRLKLYMVKALGPNWIYPKVLRELVDAILRVPSIYERSQQLAEFLKDHKKSNVTFRRARRTIHAIRDQPVPTVFMLAAGRSDNYNTLSAFSGITKFEKLHCSTTKDSCEHFPSTYKQRLH